MQSNMKVSEKPNWNILHPRVRPQNLRHEARDRGGGASWNSTPRSHKAPTSALANSGEGPLRRVQDMLASQQVPKVGRLLARRRPALQPCQKWGSRLALSLPSAVPRSEEHTSELQSHSDLVCRLLLEKKKNTRLN